MSSTDVADHHPVGRLARAVALILPVAIILAGIAASVGLALMPGSVFSSQTNGACGTPVVDVFATTRDSFEASCRQTGFVYVGVGLLLGALIVWGGLMLLQQAMPPDRRAERPSRRRLTASALAALAIVVLAVTVAGAVTYETGSQAPIYSGDK